VFPKSSLLRQGLPQLTDATTELRVTLEHSVRVLSKLVFRSTSPERWTIGVAQSVYLLAIYSFPSPTLS